VWPILRSCPMFRCLFIVQCDFCLDIIPVNVLCISQSKPLHCTSSPFPPSCVVPEFSMNFVHSCCYTDVKYLINVHYFSFLFLLS
jgi:hypothetical protein